MVGGPDRRSQWLKGLLDLCVLGILTRGEAYGYEIARTLEERGIGEIKGGTLYPALAKLETEGLVEATWRSGEAGPNRKYYLITDSGRHVLATESAAWVEFSTAASRLIGADQGAAR
jgi:PadR family transcriptional regulator, regulatory protein PadR